MEAKSSSSSSDTCFLMLARVMQTPSSLALTMPNYVPSSATMNKPKNNFLGAIALEEQRAGCNDMIPFMPQLQRHSELRSSRSLSWLSHKLSSQP